MHRSRNYPRRKHSAPVMAPRFTPAADASLKRVFAAIGVPESRPFTPDRFQLDALEAIAHSDCLVTAPTGSGKTWIAEQAISRIQGRGGRAWYACPLKALSNAKYADFSRLYGPDQVGILTGDRKENPDAPIVVGTTEILRNQLYDAMHRGESLGSDFVVIDEAHFLGDSERGVVWEEVMIYLPARIPLLLLSATIGNGSEIAAWLSSIRGRPCAVVEEIRRPVPLFPLFLLPTGLLLPLMAPSRSGRPPTLHPKVRDVLGRKNRGMTRSAKLPPFGRILDVLRRYDLLPAIFFLKSRADCDQALDACRDNPVLDLDRRRRLTSRLNELAQQSPRISRHRQLWHLEHLAVGAHHAGQLPSWKIVLERLMTEGLLDAVFATTTVAAGVNFPARTIALLNSDRFNGTQFLPLDPTEFHQMTGRAGRRGMDHIGFALAIPGRFMDIRHICRLLNSPPSDVVSQIRINFSMTLNLLLSHTPDQVEELLRNSFATYRIRQKTEGRRATHDEHLRLWHDFKRHLKFLAAKGYVDDRQQLTEEGLWAARLRVDQPLMIAEGFRQGLFPQDDPALLTAMITVFVNEKQTDERIDKRLCPKSLLTCFQRMTRRISPFLNEMLEGGFEARGLYLRPAAALWAWANASPWERVVRTSEMEEGDLAMLILRTADNLRHVRGLTGIFPQAAESAARGIELILRDPVVGE
ncbi:MAG: DEAD/DEAH box helicase [Hyphomicrobiales bacterium]